MSAVADSNPDYIPPYGERLKPKPFKYEYGLQSKVTGASFNKKEVQDEQGNIVGEVVVSLPDGRIQTTNYNADFYDGYVADVKYVGSPTFPKEPNYSPPVLKPRPSPHRQIHSKPSKFQNFPYKNHNTPVKSSFRIIPEPEEEKPAKPQTTMFDSIKFNPVKVQEETRSSAQSESMADVMAKVRENLKNINTNKKEMSLPKQNSFNTGNDDMAEVMQKIRDDLRNLEKLRVQPVAPKTVNVPIVAPSTNKKMEDIMKKIKEDMKKQELNKKRKNVNKSAMKTLNSMITRNPETPPVMKIKSHIVVEQKDKMAEIIKKMNENRQKSKAPTMMSIKSHVKAPMSIKSHVISAPPPADSMEEIMKKIRQDLEKTNDIELPPPVMKIKSHIKTEKNIAPDSMIKIANQIREDLQTSEKLVIRDEKRKEVEFATKKPLRDEVIDFMRKVELMKEKEEDEVSPIMSVKSRVIQQTSQDSDGNTAMKIVSHVKQDDHQSSYK